MVKGFNIEKIRRPLTNVTTPVGCKKIGGKWDTEYGVCIQFTDNKTYGILAPIRNTVFAYWTIDLSKRVDGWDEEYFNGKFAPEVIGCPVEYMEAIPERDWFMCHHSIFDNFEYFDDSEEIYRHEKDAFEEAKNLGLNVASDVKQGKARDWYMEYIDKKRKPVCIGPRCAAIDNYLHPECSYAPSEPKKHSFSFKRRIHG